jgi:hypothetical protein
MPVCAAAFDSGNHGSLSSFARAIAGVVFGWDQTQAGDFAQDFNYLLPKNHWYRSNDPADWQGTQVDPFYDLAEHVPDDDTESYGLRPDSSRVDECSDQNEGTLKYSKSTQNGTGPKQLTNPHQFQQNATDDPHSDGSDASTPPSDDSGLAQASSKTKAGLSSSKQPFRNLSEADDNGNASPQDVEAKEELPRTPPSPPKRSRSEVDEDEEDDDRNRKRRMSSESRT